MMTIKDCCIDLVCCRLLGYSAYLLCCVRVCVYVCQRVEDIASFLCVFNLSRKEELALHLCTIKYTCAEIFG